MKNLKLFLLAVIAVSMFNSCKKEEEKQKEPDYRDNIVGTYTLKNTVSIFYDLSTPVVSKSNETYEEYETLSILKGSGNGDLAFTETSSTGGTVKYYTSNFSGSENGSSFNIPFQTPTYSNGTVADYQGYRFSDNLAENIHGIRSDKTLAYRYSSHVYVSVNGVPTKLFITCLAEATKN